MRLHTRLLVVRKKRDETRELARFFTTRSRKDMKALGLNGCGGKGGWFNPPELDFGGACNFHDLLYMAGGSKWDRLAADALFLDLMLDAIRFDARARRSWLRRGALVAAAHTYFLAVRLFGAKFFKFGRKLGVQDLTRQTWIKRGTR